MALSATNIVTGNVIEAADVIQFYNALTGVMTDQPYTLAGQNAALLSVGRQGSTNPALLVNTNTASSATGISIVAAASGANVAVSAIGGTNESLLLAGKGSGIVQTTAATASATVGALKAINSNASAVGMAAMLSNLAANNAANAAELGFSMNNSTPAEVQFGGIRVTSTTVTAGAEDGTMIFRTQVAGAMTTGMALAGKTLSFSGATSSIWTSDANELDIGANATAILKLTSGGGVQVGSPTGGDKGAGTINATNLYVQGTAVSAGSAALTVIGPTFDNTATIAITPTDTFVTGATLASALVAGKTYLIGAQLATSNNTTDAITVRIFDTTNNVTICDTQLPLVNGSGTSLSCLYFGYAGTPTIVVQAANHTNTDKNIISTLTFNGATNKATVIYAVQLT